VCRRLGLTRPGPSPQRLLTPGNSICQPDQILRPQNVAVDNRRLRRLKAQLQRRQFTQTIRIIRAIGSDQAVNQVPPPTSALAPSVQTKWCCTRLVRYPRPTTRKLRSHSRTVQCETSDYPAASRTQHCADETLTSGEDTRQTPAMSNASPPYVRDSVSLDRRTGWPAREKTVRVFLNCVRSHNSRHPDRLRGKSVTNPDICYRNSSGVFE
jgi:hypothetical protein